MPVKQVPSIRQTEAIGRIGWPKRGRDEDGMPILVPMGSDRLADTAGATR